MRRLLPRLFFALFGFSVLVAVSAGQQVDQDLEWIQSEWQALVTAPVNAQEKAEGLRALGEKLERLSERHPERLEVHFWQAVVASSHAKMSGRAADPALDGLIARLRGEPPSDSAGG